MSPFVGITNLRLSKSEKNSMGFSIGCGLKEQRPEHEQPPEEHVQEVLPDSFTNLVSQAPIWLEKSHCTHCPNVGIVNVK